MMLSPCTATMPAASPTSFFCHGAGNASIAAASTSVASTPLQPASIETAKPWVLRSTLPVAVTPGSATVTSQALTAASMSVQGTTKYRCATGVSSRPKSTASIATNVTKKRSTSARPGSSARERRIRREVAADAIAHRLGELRLLPIASELQLLVGVRDERGLDQDRRDIRRLQHREARLLDDGLVQC